LRACGPTFPYYIQGLPNDYFYRAMFPSQTSNQASIPPVVKHASALLKDCDGACWIADGYADILFAGSTPRIRPVIVHQPDLKGQIGEARPPNPDRNE